MEPIVMMFFLCFVLDFVPLFVGAASGGNYEWDIDTVKYSKDGADVSLDKTADLTCYNPEDCQKNFVRIRVKRFQKIDPYFDVSLFTNPRVQLVLKSEQKEFLHIIDPFVVESNTCFCLLNKTFTPLAIERHEYPSNEECLPSSLVCSKIYLAPIKFMEKMMSVTAIVEASRTGLFIPRKSVTFHNTNIQDNVKSLIEVLPTFDFEDIEPNITQMINVPENTRVWMMPFANHVLISSNEFEAYRVGKLASSISKGLPVVCPDWKDEIQSILSLNDRLMVASRYGLLEQIEATEHYMYMPALVLQRCIKSLRTVAETESKEFYVIAMEEGSNSLYATAPVKGLQSQFLEPRSINNLTISQELDFSDSNNASVVFATCTGNRAMKILFLVKLTSYQLIEFAVHTGVFTKVFDFSKQISQAGASSANESYELSELAFTQMYSDHIFIWGNVLLYSPNAGKEMLKLMYLGDDRIKIFVTSHKGEYAFITEAGQFYFGKVGLTSIRKLPAVTQEKLFSLFFDSSGNLMKLLSTTVDSSPVIKRSRVYLRQAIQTQNIARDLHNRQRLTNNSSSCSQLSSQQKPERLCPFARLDITSMRYPVLSRQSTSVFCLDRLNSRFVSSIEEAASMSHDVKNLKMGSNYLDNCLWESPSGLELSLMKSISLGRNLCYNFEVNMYLDLPQDEDSYSHNFTLDDLRLSIAVSNAANLRVMATRNVSFSDNKVFYKVFVCDSGKNREQSRPGISEDIETVEVKVPGAGLNCITNKFQDSDDFKGYFTTEVKLGCPRSQKVIFDPAASQKIGGKQYCFKEDSNVPCFHFNRVFNPVFRLYDEATLTNFEFTGTYTLTAVGGGETLESMVPFTAEEKSKFNYIPGYLIWAPQDSFEDKPIYNKKNRAVRWICSYKSPCAGIAPVFPKSAAYYIKVEFSNREVDKSNCDFTFQFTIKIHGLIPGSINPSLVIVLVCLLLMIAALIFGFFIRKHYSHVLKRIQWRQILQRCFKRVTVSVVKEDEAIASENIELKENLKSEEDVPAEVLA